MADKRAVAVGMYSSALPKKPVLRNTNDPEALSASEGSGQGAPACSSAWPEAQPLTGALRDDPTTSSTNHHEGNSGLGANCTLTPGPEPPLSQVASSLGLQRTRGQALTERVEAPTASTPTSSRRISFLPTTLGWWSKSSPPLSKESPIQKHARAAKHPPTKPFAPNHSPDGDAGESRGAAGGDTSFGGANRTAAALLLSAARSQVRDTAAQMGLAARAVRTAGALAAAGTSPPAAFGEPYLPLYGETLASPGGRTPVGLLPSQTHGLLGAPPGLSTIVHPEPRYNRGTRRRQSRPLRVATAHRPPRGCSSGGGRPWDRPPPS